MQEKSFLTLSLFLVFVAIKAKELPPCIDVEPTEDFDGNRYSGKWFEYAKTDQNEEVANWACIRYTYFAPKDDGTFSIIRLLKYESDGSLHILLKNSKLFKNGQGISFDGYKFTIAAVDYANWAVLIACDESINGRIIWILTRAQKPADTVVQAINSVLSKNNIAADEVNLVDQDNCPGLDWSAAELEEDDFKYEDVQDALSFYNYTQ